MSLTAEIKQDGPIRVNDSKGILVSLGSIGTTGTYEISLKIPAIRFESTQSVELPSMGNREVLFEIAGELCTHEVADVELVVSYNRSVIVTRRIKIDLLPLFTFDSVSYDFISNICDVIKRTTNKEDSRISIIEDVEQTYHDLSFIQIVKVSPARYINITDPELILQYGDGTPEDVAVAFMKRLFSKGYACCLIKSTDGMFVGISNDPHEEDSSILDNYMFIRPADACEGLPASVSMDIAKNMLRPFMSVARKGRDFGFIS